MSPFDGPLHTPPVRTHTHRVVMGLELAWECAEPTRPQPKARGLTKGQKDGLRFEKTVGRILPKASRKGVWFEYFDANGKGLCQPDWLCPLPGGREVLIVECKRTECPEALTQLTQLYFPVVGKALGLLPRGLIIAKFLTPRTPRDRLFSDFECALEAARCGGQIPILHWM